MATPKAAHHRGTHQVRARQVTRAAYLNPDTVCGAPPDVCKGWGNRTLAEHPNTSTGKPPSWHAGHVIAGVVNGELRPWVNVCNTSDGAIMRNTRSEPHSERW